MDLGGWSVPLKKEDPHDGGENLKMRSKIDPETMKILVPGAVLDSSGDPLGGLGVSGGTS